MLRFSSTIRSLSRASRDALSRPNVSSPLSLLSSRSVSSLSSSPLPSLLRGDGRERTNSEGKRNFSSFYTDDFAKQTSEKAKKRVQNRVLLIMTGLTVFGCSVTYYVLSKPQFDYEINKEIDSGLEKGRTILAVLKANENMAGSIRLLQLKEAEDTFRIAKKRIEWDERDLKFRLTKEDIDYRGKLIAQLFLRKVMVHLLLGEVYEMKNEFDKAEKSYLDVSKMISDSLGNTSLMLIDPSFRLGKLYESMGRTSEAVGVLNHW